MFLPSPMSEERLKALLKKGKGDTSLQEKFKAAASPDAAVEIAKDAGFAITAITTFFFAITIIGPHTPVQANYYQGCNEECQEARRRSAEMELKPPPKSSDPTFPEFPDTTFPEFSDPTMPKFSDPTFPEFSDPTMPKFPDPELPSYQPSRCSQLDMRIKENKARCSPGGDLY